MSVRSLGYLVFGAADIDAWRRYATDILGAQVEDDAAGGLRLRVDSRAFRIAIEPSPLDDILAAGWEVGSAAELDRLVATLTAAGVAVSIDPARAARRGVCALARFADPAGVESELFWGATERHERPFHSPAGVSGFVTGAEGLGHIVVAAADPPAMQAFYADLLGFRLSDYIDMPMGPDLIIPVTFMHCNARHHSIAFAPAPPPKKLLHFMLQTRNFDDVGFALDRVGTHGVELSLTLGRHINDQMVSFYAYTPSGFEVEYGWGAREIDDATWLPGRHDRISIWGHRFLGRPGTVQA